jgi:hypothetical protein
MKNLWRSQDLFGKQVAFTFKGKRAYQTSIGALISVFIKIVLGFFIAYEMYAIFSRKHPAMAIIERLNRDTSSDGVLKPFQKGFQIAFTLKIISDPQLQ